MLEDEPLVAVDERRGVGGWTDQDEATLQTLAGVAGDVLRSTMLVGRLRALTNSQSEGVIAVDLEGRVTFANPAAVSMTGYEAYAELRGESIESVCRLRHGQRLTDLMSLLSRRETAQDVDATLVRHDGSLVDVAYSLTPLLEADDTTFGMRATSIRKVGSEQIYVRTSPYILPSFSIVPGPPTAQFEEDDIRAFRFWVPIDDKSTWLYILNMRNRPFSDEERKSFRSWINADYRRIRNKHNDYLQDRTHQKTKSYSGIAAVIPAEQDGCATESMGPICDRTKEHLGYSDKTIIALRKMLLRAVSAVKEGKDPPHVIRDSRANDFSKLRSLKAVLPAQTPWRKILEGLGPNDG